MSKCGHGAYRERIITVHTWVGVQGLAEAANACSLQFGKQRGVQRKIVTLPQQLQATAVHGLGRVLGGQRSDQRHIAISAPHEACTVFRSAIGAEHAQEFNSELREEPACDASLQEACPYSTLEGVR